MNSTETNPATTLAPEPDSPPHIERKLRPSSHGVYLGPAARPRTVLMPNDMGMRIQSEKKIRPRNSNSTKKISLEDPTVLHQDGRKWKVYYHNETGVIVTNALHSDEDATRGQPSGG